MEQQERIMTLGEYREKFRKKLDKQGKKDFDSLWEGAVKNNVLSVKVVGSNRYHKVYAANTSESVDSQPKPKE